MRLHANISTGAPGSEAQLRIRPAAVPFSEDAATRAVTSLQEFLRFETVCAPGEALNVGDAKAATFTAARDHLKQTYTDLLSNPDISITEISTYSLLLEWKGTRDDLDPLLVCGHYDVVPVGNDSIASWTHDPFGGYVVGGCDCHNGCLTHPATNVRCTSDCCALHKLVA